MGKQFKRQNGESMSQFIERCRNEQAAAGRVWPPIKPKRKRKSRAKSAVTPRPDPDGMDRDDFGLSPDY